MAAYLLFWLDTSASRPGKSKQNLETEQQSHSIIHRLTGRMSHLPNTWKESWHWLGQRCRPDQWLLILTVFPVRFGLTMQLTVPSRRPILAACPSRILAFGMPSRSCNLKARSVVQRK